MTLTISTIKTLLFLLCIYIKRVNAASVTISAPTTTQSSLPTNTSSQLQQPVPIRTKLTKYGATDRRIFNYDSSFVNEYEMEFNLRCPIESLIELKEEFERLDATVVDSLRENVIKDVKVMWYKDGQPFHRENGNYVSKTDGIELPMHRVGISDQGKYTCVIDYRNVSKQSYVHFKLCQGASFKLRVEELKSVLPDKKPTISHPPANMVVRPGSNITYTCNRIDTLLTQTTYWFKLVNLLDNKTAPIKWSKFAKAFLETAKDMHIGHLDEYRIKGHRDDTLQVNGVSDYDIGYYGCLVGNANGIDIRLGTLDLFGSHVRTKYVDNPNFSVEPNLYDNTIISDTRLDPYNNYTLPVNIPNVQATISSGQNPSGYIGSLTWPEGVSLAVCIMILVAAGVIVGGYLRRCRFPGYGKKLNNLCLAGPTVGNGCEKANLRQHLPSGESPDIYNIGKSTNGFISGHLHQNGGHLLTQSVANILEREKNPSISSKNSDEASSLGKSMSYNGDTCKASYSHTSNTTTTTVPLYDQPPPTSTAHLRGAMIRDACVINLSYGFIPPETDTAAWAFPRRNLFQLDKIGEGQFGEVWRYNARQKDGREEVVAVKKLKNRVGLGYRERLELIAEIEIMKLVNNHPNVIKLYNCCVDDYEPILLIMEYAENGKLQTYLRSCRTNRKSHNYICESSVPNVTSKELIKFAYHIAKGMEYVASKGIVHRDLASRNILVTKDRVCKVADFGFARRVNEECAYERTTANPVPIKWMAPEALVENKFTSKSDVFSLGILMWEIATLGATPYEYMTSSEVYKKVTTGGRLERPAHCKDEFSDLMATCWHHDPSQRPTFKALSSQLEKLLLSENDYIELDQYPEHAYYNILSSADTEFLN